MVWPGRPAEGAGGAESGGAHVVDPMAAVAVPRRVMTEIADGKERIAGLVEQLKALTGREILACGQVLSTLVDTVRDLIAETDRTMAASLARSEDLTSRFVAGMQEDILAQETAVKQALLLADGIEGAIDAINTLAHSSHMLAINASIEAARLGSHGRGVAVIADQMREMSKTVRATADQVRSSIGAVRQGLPPVKERATSMHERTKSFIGVVGIEMKSASLQTDTGSAGSGRLDAVMELSNTALSHLQFQDPFVHRLGSINHDLDVIERRVRRVLEGEVDLEPAADHRVSGGAEPRPGELVLF